MQYRREEEIQKNLVEYRRDFHKYAEIKWTEFRTTSIVAQKLIALGYDIMLGSDMAVKGFQFAYPDIATIKEHQNRAIQQGADSGLIGKMDDMTGVVGVLDTGREGPTTAFRFDMDALPTQEKMQKGHYPYDNGFVSINEGYMHACGHDGHTAIGLVFAEELIRIKNQLKGKVKLIFQPSEEGGGGAIGIVEKGILDDVDYFFAGHVGLTKKDGKPLGSGGIICGVDDFLDSRRINVDYIGKAAHPCGDPNKGRNALLAACNAAMNIHAIAPHSEGMLRVNVGVLNSGFARNIIAPNAHMEIDSRGENKTVADYGEKKVTLIIENVAKMYEVESKVEIVGRTSSAKSDKEAINIVYDAAKEISWFKELYKYGSVGGSDDASEMINRVQQNGGFGTYIGLGADFASSFHDSEFDFDENVMLPSVQLFTKLVEKLHK